MVGSVGSRGHGWRRYVSPADFFTSDAEKTKLDWFLFEFALELETAIQRDKRLVAQLWRKGVGGQQVGQFCVRYAKHMKGQVLDRVSGRIPHVRIGYEEIEAFCPAMGDRLVDRLVVKAGQAWDSLTGMCVSCPTRCISEKDERAPMFDDPMYRGTDV